MSQSTSIREIFLQHVDSAHLARFSSWANLEDKLNLLLGQIMSAWPGFSILPEDFIPLLAKSVSADPDPETGLNEVKSSDLYLAQGCARGFPAAIATFEARCAPIINKVLLRLRIDQTTGEDIKQIIRQKILVGDGVNPPKIVQYTGRGELESWVRVIAMRHTLNILRDNHSFVLAEEEILENLAAPDDDPTLLHLKKVYRKEFKEIFKQALIALTARERNLLRLRLIDGLKFEELGTIYKVNATTVFRWIAAIHEKMKTETRNNFTKRFQLKHNEFNSIMKLVQSQFEMSIQQILEDDS